MKIYTLCLNCKREASLLTHYKDRVTLARKKGNGLSVNCQGCGNIFKPKKAL